MIFSLSKKFLFIANLKSASTSIESVLAPHAELRLQRTEFGKHMSYGTFVENFEWLAGHVNMNEVFSFGVIRDPVEYMLSLFNSHRREVFKNNEKLYTGDMDFDKFLDVWTTNNSGQVNSQIWRFIKSDGKLAVSYLISYNKLDEGLQVVSDKLNIPELAKIPKLNVSPPHMRRDLLTTKHVEWIEKRFIRDYEAISTLANKIS